jgi:uncharacterized small protein (DUF1192 family)
VCDDPNPEKTAGRRIIGVVTEPSPTVADLAAEVARLEAEIRETRAMRSAAERVAGGLHTTQLAVETADRDRDALTSPELENLRGRAENLISRLRERWAALDRIRLHAGMLGNSGVELADDPGINGGAVLMDVFRSESELRAEARRELAEVGLYALPVPQPAEVAPANQARRQRLSESLGEVMAERADRERHARKPGHLGQGTAGHGAR